MRYARLLRWLAGLLLAALLAGPAAAASFDLAAGDFLASDAPLPPPEQAAWQPVSLPDLWRISRPDSPAERGWYRFRLSLPAAPGGLQAVYLPKLVMTAEIYLNGVLIGHGGRFEEPVSRYWNRPLFVLVPPGLLGPGDNLLHVRLRSHPYTQAGLHPLRVGAEAELRESYERTYFLNVTLNQTATLLIAAIGLLMLSLWLRRRQDTAYAYFGASALVWAAQSTNLYVRDVPVSTATWEILANGGFQIFAGLLLISLLRFVGVGNRRLVGVLWGGLLVAPLSLALAPAGRYLALTAGWHLFTLAGAIATVALLLRAALRQDNREARYLVAAMGPVLLFAGHDWLIHSQHIWLGGRHWPLNDVFLLHYSAPVIYLAIGLIMTGRFVRVLNEFERLNDQLEEHVAAKQRELQQSYQRMRQLETEQAVAEERERIYRDLHDDVGAKLLSLVYRAAQPGDADLARSALQDLRDVVSRSGADSFELAAALADWRAEGERRLGDAGIALHWAQSGEIDGPRLNQPQALNLGRILREALSNVIRHAGASRVEVEVACAGGRLRLGIADNGRGCPASAGGSRGRGLRNMEMRAERLGGRLLRTTPAGGGCRIELDIPLA